MFNKSSDDRPRFSGGGAKASVLSADLEVQGNVISVGSIDISGRVTGEVEGQTVLLGNDGQITGKLRAGTADILGQLDGEVSADSLTLRSSARARLVAVSKVLVIESGATVEGQFSKPAAEPAPKRTPDPAPPAAAPVQPAEGGIE
jgi:cytoskeletal protein CcmA (bactofilin family)